jgi:DNA-binding response OmpR family regulator
MDRVLVVDDDEKVCKLLRLALEREGFEVDAVSDGKEALRMIRSRRVRLVITDIVMPEQDGLELLTALRNGEVVRYLWRRSSGLGVLP